MTFHNGGDASRRAPDVLIIGAGAAGLMAAFTAARRGRRVVVLDHAPEVGRKILISGGGRCNFTNTEMRAERFISQNKHFARSALSRYTPVQFLELLAKHKIPWHEKKLGQLFCDNSARDIVQMLLAECAAANVTILTDVRITDVTKPQDFRVQTSAGTFTSKALVLATGGLSIPKLGATSFSYNIARYFGLSVVSPEPALVPLVFGQPDESWVQSLAGVSLPVRASCGKIGFDESLLFTHRGLSGPALLQISSYWEPGQAIRINLLPGEDLNALLAGLKKAKGQMKGPAALGRWLPHRLAQELARQSAPEERPVVEWPDRTLRALADRIHRLDLHPTGTEGFAKAEVTRGGVDTRKLSSKTMEAQTVPNLYVIGEAVDVTGWLGGYNFHWAWASGHAAGEALGESAAA
ncbi:NAD(FAD)-utilizing dehydrogenase [Acetobacter malorum]|uniref:NAD(FAD)-utilizing dehydrogenase n=1 Tax=Acetobacter malorum TaxID=178901 RepID=A0A177GA28_9PROT|nr:NAD(P)/FAD-dependent oxidoreductase [Acetobacter malorum]OAG76631.1 NAD(FAD)-utilizing dehydrogenase [Acetobacter malorum]